MPLRKAVVLTAYNRVGYLNTVLDSWFLVEDQESWDFIVSIDLSPVSSEILASVRKFKDRTNFRTFQVIQQTKKLGVLEHPYRVIDDLFRKSEFDFVVRVEDDLIVSTDFLLFMNWAMLEFSEDKEIATVYGYSKHESSDVSGVRVVPDYCPLNWGTWRDRWIEYIGPTWDHDYSSFNGFPGNQSGWDWNLNTRVLPRMGKMSAFPTMSRVQNIGRVGTHATPDDFPEAPSFQDAYKNSDYQVRGR